ncbi:MAG TPA: XRE family transcriptional regulator [Acidimicrobiales bacterium]|nr:XRE family transcriptional regulator [Acidimicrobiales bacterium]
MATPGSGIVGSAVARTVRSLRTERAWSIDELQARSGVSKGALVDLEHGRANPSLTTLVRLAESFGVPLTRLVQVDEEPVVQLVPADRAVTLWHGPGGGTGTLLVGTGPPRAVELWRWELRPGEALDSEAHAAGTRELLTVEAGRLTVAVDGKAHLVGGGDSVAFVGDRPHRYANKGPHPVRFVMAVTVPQPAAT